MFLNGEESVELCSIGVPNLEKHQLTKLLYEYCVFASKLICNYLFELPPQVHTELIPVCCIHQASQILGVDDQTRGHILCALGQS